MIGAAGVGVVVVVMVVAVELQPEGGADGEGTDDKQGDTHKEFSPGGHGLNMGEVLETDGDQGENNNTGGMTGPPARALRQAARGLLREKEPLPRGGRHHRPHERHRRPHR